MDHLPIGARLVLAQACAAKQCQIDVPGGEKSSHKRKRRGAFGASVNDPNATDPVFTVTKCDHGNGSYERHFVYRLSSASPVPSTDAIAPSSSSLSSPSQGHHTTHHLWMDALVMANGICVLTFPISCLSERLSMATKCASNYFADLHQSSIEISGKRKKGARKVQVGTKIFQLDLDLSDDHGNVASIVLHSPIPGQLLEINKRLQRDTALLCSQPQGAGYVAVVFPDCEIPSLENGGIARVRSNVCYAYQNTGQCTRGSNCKFAH